MHSLSNPDESLFPSWRHPNGGARYFNNDRAQEWIRDYNTTENPDALEQLLAHVEPLAKSLLEYRCTTRHAPMDELLSRIRIKLWHSLKLYDARRGSAFSFCSMVISRVAISAVNESWSRDDRFCALSETDCSAPAQVANSEAIAEIEYRVRQVKTSCTEPAELRAQKWYVESLISCAFKIRRHEASNCAMDVFGLDHVRSRQLFDLTMVAVRRELIPNRRLHPVSPLDLRGTKLQALIRYAKYLSSEEFTRLATLLRDVAPSVVFTVRSENTGAIRRGEERATRENLELVLCGSLDDRPLFPLFQ
jgi:hypothetical protein